ncbi:MAG: hypothetical protein LBQ71_15455 [Hungatella sp.]|nr:hypothetical protein [Hungatella sp.]
MAVKLCLSCRKFTFFETADGRLCSKCGYKMTLPNNAGKELKNTKGEIKYGRNKTKPTARKRSWDGRLLLLRSII